MHLLLDFVMIYPRRKRFLYMKTNLSRNVSHGHTLNTATHHTGRRRGGEAALPLMADSGFMMLIKLSETSDVG